MGKSFGIRVGEYSLGWHRKGACLHPHHPAQRSLAYTGDPAPCRVQLWKG